MARVNSEKMKAPIMAAKEMLRKQKVLSDEFQRQKKELINSDMYSKEYKEKRIEELADGMRKAVKQALEGLEEQLDSIVAIAKEADVPIDIMDTRIQSATAIINAAGSDLDKGTQESIISMFKGDQQALSLISSLFKAKKIDNEQIEGCMMSSGKLEADIEHMKGDRQIIDLFMSKGMNTDTADTMTEAIDGIAEVYCVDMAAE